MHKIRNIILLFCLYNVGLLAQQDIIHISMFGADSIKSDFFKKWYHQGDLVYYLEALNDHTIVENHTTGQWWLPDRLVIGVEGNSFFWNRYYIDGFRVDDRFQPGSTQYVPNMEQTNLWLNTHTSQFLFETFPIKDNYRFTYNWGGITKGNPAFLTEEIVHIFHRTCTESADTYKHITERMHQCGAWNTDNTFTLGGKYQQHFYMHWGQRLTTKLDERGLILHDPFYMANYCKAQASGEIPIKYNVWDKLSYRINVAMQEDAGSAFLYNYDEVYTLKNYTASLYGMVDYGNKKLTTGFTWATNVVTHNEQEFAKNIIDQDGESFFPWVADGKTHELSWAMNYQQQLTDWLQLKADCYNSAFYFSPTNHHFSNTIYFRPMSADKWVDLYRYEWQSNPYWSGLLENTVGLQVDKVLTKKLGFRAKLDLTLDGMFLSQKSKVSCNYQGQVALDFHPNKWFEMGYNLEVNRLPYTTDYLRFFSNNYMNAEVLYCSDNALYTTSGGKYHHRKKGLRQPIYLNADFPIRFHWQKERGVHEVALLQSFRKYINLWNVAYKDKAHGVYKRSIFFQQGKQEYEVDYMEATGEGFLKDSPYYFSQLTRYTYTGKKVMLAVSWQSMQEGGLSALGNGPNSNTIGVLCESLANPNTHNVADNPKGKFKGTSRNDLDKGFVGRIFVSYNINEHIQLGSTLKWTDGKPFVHFRYHTRTDPQEHLQVAIQPLESRGTNPTDGNFGTRHAAVWHVDLHLQTNWTMNNHPTSLFVECYNIWDFSNDLAEFSFYQDNRNASRSSIILRVPTGLLATLKVEL